MDRCRLRRLEAALFVLVVLATIQVAAQTRKDLERSLRQALVGNLSFLQAPYSGSHLRFDQSGKLTGAAEAGPWTTYGLIAIRNIELKADSLNIRAERAIAALRRTDTGTQLVPMLTEQPLNIAIELPPSADTSQVKSALSAVLQGGNVNERLRSYWKPNWDLALSKDVVAREHPDGVVGVLEGARNVYMNTPSTNVQPPKAIHTPDPDYPEAARKKRTQGTTVIEVIIDERGFPEILEVSRSLEDGLDVKALSAVAQWRFRPALKDGVAVPVKISVEVNFRLY